MKVLYPVSRPRSPLPLTKAGHGLSGVPRPRYKVEPDDLEQSGSFRCRKGRRIEDEGRRRVSRKAAAFLGATWTLSRLDLQPSKFEIFQVPHCQRDPTGDHGEDEDD